MAHSVLSQNKFADTRSLSQVTYAWFSGVVIRYLLLGREMH